MSRSWDSWVIKVWVLQKGSYVVLELLGVVVKEGGVENGDEDES